MVPRLVRTSKELEVSILASSRFFSGDCCWDGGIVWHREGDDHSSVFVIIIVLPTSFSGLCLSYSSAVVGLKVILVVSYL